MSSFNDKGFVIKLVPLNENDKVVSVLSQKNGRINAVAKGINKIKSRSAASLDLLNNISFRAFQGKSNLDLITEVRLIDDFHSLKTDLDIINLNLYVLEVIDKLIIGHESTQSIYELVSSYLNYHKEEQLSLIDRLKILISFQFKILDNLGYTPLLDECVVCGEKFKEGEFRIASADNQIGYICGRHTGIAKQRNNIEDVILKIQKYLLNHNLIAAKQLQITPNQLKSLFTIQNLWIQNVMEKKINITDIINSILLKAI